MSEYTIIDTNALLLYLIGKIDIKLVGDFKFKDNLVSIYAEEDFRNLADFIEPGYKNLLILPNILTEVDNHLNKHFKKGRYEKALQHFIELATLVREEYIPSIDALFDIHTFGEVGLTDMLIVVAAKKYECKQLITGDSGLANLAMANSIEVIDLVFYRTHRIRNY